MSSIYYHQQRGSNPYLAVNSSKLSILLVDIKLSISLMVSSPFEMDLILLIIKKSQSHTIGNDPSVECIDCILTWSPSHTLAYNHHI